MPAHIIHGDPFLTARQIKEIKQELGLDDPNRYAEQRYNAVDTDADTVASACRTQPFLEDTRIVIVDGVLTTRNRKQAASRQWDRMADVVQNMPKANLLLLVDDKVPKSNTLLKRLTPHCAVHELPAPAGNGLTRWVTDTAKAKGNRIRADAAQMLADILGNDLWKIDQELEKLSLYCAEGEITTADIEKVVDQAKTVSIFAAIDAMVENRSGDALQLVAQLMQNGPAPLALLGLINRQLRLMALARDLTERGIPQHRWEKSWGFTSEFVARKTAQQAARHSRAHIEEMYDRALDADLAVKTGKAEPEPAVELLTVELANLR